MIGITLCFFKIDFDDFRYTFFTCRLQDSTNLELEIKFQDNFQNGSKTINVSAIYVAFIFISSFLFTVHSQSSKSVKASNEEIFGLGICTDHC